MGSNGFQCPEDSNSTDCLLRALLQSFNEKKKADDKEINWDPISFSITVLIGILALLFASATIFQAISATGKSRRVTSNRAIGKWSRQTRKTWSWTEMNFQYTASTPILLEKLFPPIIEQCEESLDGSHVDEDCDNQEIETRNDPNEARTSRKLQRRNIFRGKRSSMPPKTEFRGPWNPQSIGPEVPKSSQYPSHHPSAAWLEFFKEVGLDKLEIRDWNDSIREVSADYLPGDLTAAPAYGQVGAIIAAAATAGIQKLYIDQQNYPIVLGHGFQIDFRQHPSLSLIGAYSRYGKARKSESSGDLGLEELRFSMQYGRGIVPFRGSGTMDVYAKAARRRILGQWFMGQKGFALQNPTDEEKYFFIDRDVLSEGFLPLIVGLQACTPRYIPALFPVASMQTGFPLTALALQGTYWAKEDLRRYSKSHIYQWPEPHFAESWGGFRWHDIGDPTVRRSDIEKMYLDLEPKYVDFIAGMRGAFVEKISQNEPSLVHAMSHSASIGARAAGSSMNQPADESAEAPISRDRLETRAANTNCADAAATWSGQGSKATSTDGNRVVLHMCLKLLYRPEELQAWFFGASPVEQRALRLIILEQMKQVDQWLNREVPNKETRSIFLCNTTIFFSRAEKIIEQSPDCLDPHSKEPRKFGRQESVESARAIHDKTLRILRKVLRSPEENQSLVQKLEKVVDPDPKYYPSRNLWDRINILVHNNLEEDPESDQPGGPGATGEPSKPEGYEDRVRNTDDVIIYRCLMMILLFQTAADSSKILESGLWGTVVPFI